MIFWYARPSFGLAFKNSHAGLFTVPYINTAYPIDSEPSINQLQTLDWGSPDRGRQVILFKGYKTKFHIICQAYQRLCVHNTEYLNVVIYLFIHMVILSVSSYWNFFNKRFILRSLLVFMCIKLWRKIFLRRIILTVH